MYTDEDYYIKAQFEFKNGIWVKIDEKRSRITGFKPADVRGATYV